MMSTSAVDLGKRLLEASRKGNAEEVRQLMANGAPITTDWLGTSPLHLAAQYGHTVTVEVLLRAGVSRDGKTKVEKTPLHLAAQQGHYEIAQMLVKFGAAINTIDMLSMTPVHWAVEARSQPICKLLMEHGARTDVKSKFGKTPVDIAKSKGYEEILEVLLSAAYIPLEGGCKRLLKNDDTLFPDFTRQRKFPMAVGSFCFGDIQSGKSDEPFSLENRKRVRTKKLSMTAGSWTVGELMPSDKEERLKAKEAKRSPKNGENSTKGITTEGIDVSVGSNLSSLVDAAAIVRSKVQDSSTGPHQVPSAITVALPNKGHPMLTEASVLDTLATLATASTQMTTSGCETNQTGPKAASHATPAAAPSYVTIPGIQGPVQIVQANPNQTGIIHQGQIASGLPPGMIQLASPLAFNILPGGRFQIGQPILPGHPLGVPIQMPLQSTGIPAGHLVAVSSGQNVALVGSIPSGQVISKPINATDTTPSRGGAVMSAVSHGITIATGSIPAVAQHSTAAATYQAELRPALKTATTASPLGIHNGLLPQQPGIVQSPIAPAQLTSALPYANLGSGLAPIPLVPVAGIGGIQLVPQALLQTQLLNAVRGGTPVVPSVGAVQPQFVTPGGTYTIPMSPLNLSSILPTALSLSQISVAQQTLAQQTMAQQSVTSALPSSQHRHKVLGQQMAATQTPIEKITTGNTQGLIIAAAQTPLVASSTPHGSIVLGAQTESMVPSVSQRELGTTGVDQNQVFTSTAQVGLGPIASEGQLLSEHAFGASISVPDLQQNISQAYQSICARTTAGISNAVEGIPISDAEVVETARTLAPLDEQMNTTATTAATPTRMISESQKQHSLLTQLTIATAESKSPSLIVNSTHSPRMPISPGGFVQADEDMQSISPSRISPTKPAPSTSLILATTSAEPDLHGDGLPTVRRTKGSTATAASPPYSEHSSLANNISSGSAVPGIHVLPHLQQLIYKQLLQQQNQPPRQETAEAAVVSESLSSDQKEAEKCEESKESSISTSLVQEHSPSHDFEERSHERSASQSEYFWRVIEQENPDLKRQFAESEMETQLYPDDFQKPDAKNESKSDRSAPWVIEQENPDLKRQFAESEMETQLYPDDFQKPDAKNESKDDSKAEEKDQLDELLLKNSNEELTNPPEITSSNNNKLDERLRATEV